MSETSSFHRPHHFYQALPKVDLYCLLEKTLRLTTLAEKTQPCWLAVPEFSGHHALVKMGEKDRRYFDKPFFSSQSHWSTHPSQPISPSPEEIVQLAYQAVGRAAADHGRYVELHFTPSSLAQRRGYDLGEVMDWVIAGAGLAGAETGIQARLAASVQPLQGKSTASQLVRLASERLERGLAALDLCGDPVLFDTPSWMGLLAEARQAGLRITWHGEASGCDSSARAVSAGTALMKLNPDRVAPDARLLENRELAARLRERQTPLEICPIRGSRAGSGKTIDSVTLGSLVQLGLNVVITTGNPVLSESNLSDAYRLACEQSGVSRPGLEERILAAARCAFLPLSQSTFLAARLTAELNAVRSARTAEPPLGYSGYRMAPVL